jgi:predicted RNase H-like nuclease
MIRGPKSFQVAGVDGCKAGWFVAVVSVLEIDTIREKTCVYYVLQKFWVAHNFNEILPKIKRFELVCVDIPIGLSDGNKPRECDLAARKILRGKRANSVFPAPIRQCLRFKDYETASKISFERSGKKLNRQSFGLLDKIRQVDDSMTPALKWRVREIHPEISFWALNNQEPMQHSKKRLIGRKERMGLLAPMFSGLEKIVTKARKPKAVEPDDILDALVAAWTAGQTVIGKAETLPKNPEFDSKGLRMEILGPAK